MKVKATADAQTCRNPAKVLLLMLLSTQAHAIIRHKMESCLRVLTSRSLLRVTSPSATRHSNNGCKLLAASHLSDSAVRRCPSSWNTTDSNDATASLKTQMFKLYADPEARSTDFKTAFVSSNYFTIE